MAEERQVKATLDLSLGPAAEKAMRDLVKGMGTVAQAYQNIQAAAEDAAKAAAGPRVIGALTGSAADAMARARGTAPPGFFGRLGSGLGKTGSALNEMAGSVGGLAGVGAAAAATTAAAANYTALRSDRFMNEGQRVRQVMMDLPGASHVNRLVENFAGRPGAMLNASVAAQQERVGIEGFGRIAPLAFSEVIPQVGRETAAGAARGAAPVFGQRIGRETAAGELAFREQARLLPLMREQAKIQREQATATSQKQAAETVYARTLDIERQAQERLNRAKAGEASLDRRGVTGPALLAAREEVANAAASVNVALETKRQAREAVRAATMTEGEVKSRGMLNASATAEARAANLEERAATAAGSAGRLGGMNPYDRSFGVQAFKALQQFGPDALPPDMLAAAQQFAPQTAGKILEQHGAGTAEFAAGRELAPADFTGSPEALRQKAEDARREAEAARLEAERTVTQVAADSGRDFGKFLEGIIRTQIQAAKDAIEQGLRIQRVS